MATVQNFAGIVPDIPFTEYNFLYVQEDVREERARKDQGEAAAAREGGELRIHEAETQAEERAQAVLHTKRQGGADVPEDVHGAELPEADEGAEW